MHIYITAHKQKNKSNHKNTQKQYLKMNNGFGYNRKTSLVNMQFENTIEIMKRIVSYYIIMLLLLLVSACATKRSSLYPIAVNTIGKDTISPGSIQLPKGKICFAYTTSYANDLPDMGVFKNKQSMNFVSRNHDNSYFGGGYSHAKADTIITNNYLVGNALYSAINNFIPGFEFMFVDQKDFTDPTGKLNTNLILEKYKPDIIINISGLSFYITGTPSTAAVVETRGGGSNEYSIGTETYYSGKIFIQYNVLWDISVTGEKNKQISMKGETKSTYYKGYEIGIGLLGCSQQVGIDFVKLLTAKKNK